MWIEQRKLQFAPLQIRQKSNKYQVICGSLSFDLSERQYQYFDQLYHGLSIHDVVKTFISRGWLVSFRELYQVLEQLISQKLILNPELHSFFSLAKEPVKVSILHEISGVTGKSAFSPEHIRTLPFFRTLHPELQKHFINHTSVRKVEEKTRICRSGDTSREMYVMVEGVAGIYRSFPDGRRQLLSTVSAGALVGEGGFLLGRPRSADIIALTTCTFASIEYSPEFSQMIDSGKAEALQRRFWVLNGLLSSEVFSQMPAETLDSLVFAGKIREVPENTVVVREGEPGRSFFIVVQGSLSFTQKGKLLRSMGQGGIFGEVALMVSGGIRTATAQAQRATILVEIGMEEFYEVLSNHLVLAKTIEEIAWHRWETRVK